ncbi:MAG: NAD(P)H:quinone oxidoreductase, type IV [Gammaproteobacteria bacterium RIFCSPHIGHO2_12_FULL_43_28]|nr:MAG: NAD(P)H:quinone oxidoreductase, type IV [Gammaproteobacteria bacterium RIFCSPHIGHO2_12_FULL_43_28]
MKTKLQIIFYSMYGHIFRMTEAVAEGAKSVKDIEVETFRVAELVPDEILKKSGAMDAQKNYQHLPIIKPEQLTEADGFIFGTPTRFGNMCAQMRNFLDQLGGLWMKDALVGKVGSVYTSTGTQHGGQETTITSFHTTLLHLGMVIVGMPYSEKRQMTMEEISGGSPYGASTLAGDGKRMPSENELAMARFQGKHVAEITRALKQGNTSLNPNARHQ